MIGLNIKYILGFTISFDGDGGGEGQIYNYLKSIKILL